MAESVNICFIISLDTMAVYLFTIGGGGGGVIMYIIQITMLNQINVD